VKSWTGLLAKEKDIPRINTTEMGDRVAQPNSKMALRINEECLRDENVRGNMTKRRSNHSTRKWDEQAMAALNGEDWEAGGSKQSSMLASWVWVPKSKNRNG
jgi:hypothetical protein